MEKKRKNRRRYCLIGRYERVFYITVGGNSISLLLYVVPDRFPVGSSSVCFAAGQLHLLLLINNNRERNGVASNFVETEKYILLGMSEANRSLPPVFVGF
jgi:hypothetical protein